MSRRILFGFAVYLFLFSPLMAQDGMPVVTDSRIKTFVYNENDVFTVLTHYGYQSNVEFGKSETVQTVSVGDRVAWQVIPAGRRLFIKALEENAHTNMTVVTNKRAYQFDLRASGRQPLHPNEELVYVVRFFYPDEQRFQPNPPIYSDAVSSAQGAMAYPASVEQSAPVPGVTANVPTAATAAANFNYTYTGPAEAAPIKIYDDGQATYFTFAPTVDAPPQFFVLSPDGQEMPIQPSYNAQGEAVVSMIAPRFSIRRGDANIQVYNENFSQQAM
jgi:type IV secretion system protein VirB9